MAGERLEDKRTLLISRPLNTREKIHPTYHCQAKNGAAVSVEEFTFVPRRLRYTFTNLEVTMTDATTAGCHGSHKFADFLAGLVGIIGAESNLAITAAAGISATGAVVGSVGSAAVATDNATLTSTEADVIPSTACTLTGSAGVMDGEMTAALFLNGTQTPADLYLNFAVPDAGASGNSVITVNGYYDVIVLVLGRAHV